MSLLSRAKKILGGTAADDDAKKQAKPTAAKQTDAVPEKAKPKASVSELVPDDVQLLPLLSEKSVRLQEQNIVTFRAPLSATKQSVARSFRKRFKTEPGDIRILYGRPKQRRRGRTQGQTRQWKKVYIKVDDVQSVNAGP